MFPQWSRWCSLKGRCSIGLILPGGASPAISGAVGGVVYSRNRGGAYARTRVKPVNPATALQNAVRATFQGLSNFWTTTLGPGDRDTWTTWANQTPRVNRIGLVSKLPANAAFIGANATRLQAGLGIIEPGPTIFALSSLSPPGTLTISGSTAVLSGLAGDDEWNAAGGALLLYVSKQQNPAKQFFKGPFQFAGALTGGTVALSAGTITLPGAMGSLTTDNLVYYRLTATAPDGRPSAVLPGVTVIP